MHLLFAINQKHIPLLYSCLNSIAIKGGEDNYDIHLLNSDFDQRVRDEIIKTIDKRFHCHFVDVPKDLFAGFPETRRYPVQIYYRLAAPFLLSEDIDRVLYLDVDTIIINPLASLYNLDFEDKWFVACSHTDGVLNKINQIRLQTEKEVPYVNTGVLLMNLSKLRKNLNLNDIRNFPNEYQLPLFLPDQDILTALYGDKVKIADELLYNISDRILFMNNAKMHSEKINVDWVRKNSVIIHYFGKNKPWNKDYFGLLDVFYHEYGLPIGNSKQ